MQLGESGDLPKREPEDFRAKARPSHPQQKSVLESRLFYFGSEGSQVGTVRYLIIGNPQPAEPMIFVRTRPERGVRPPQTPNFVFFCPIRDRAFPDSYSLFLQDAL